MDAEAELLKVEQEMKAANANNAESDEDEIDIDKVRKAYTVDDIVNDMSKQMKISKTKKSKDVDMSATKTIVKGAPNSKIAALKQKSKGKRSRGQLRF